jgi:hypothetical protein
MSARLLIAAVLTLAFRARAQSAQDELERQLREMVGKPPTKLLVEYEGLDQPNYKLAEISFELDGSSLPTPALTKLDGEGKHLIFHGDIKPGKHTLVTTVVLTDVAGVLFSYEAGYKWKVTNTRSFEQQPGLEVQVLVTPELNPSEKDAKKKFVLKSTATPHMLAKLEDGTMPEAPKPNLQVPKEEPDAGAAVVAQLSPAEKAKILKEQQAEEARLKKQQAMEDAKRKKEEAAAAKAAAIEEKKRKAQEAAEARAAAAEDRKRKAQEAAEAKKAAAEEKKRQREEALAAKKAAEEDRKRQKEEALASANAAKQPAVPKEPTQVAAADPTNRAGPGAEPGMNVAAQPSEAALAQNPAEPSAVADAGPAIAAADTPKPAQPAQPTKPAEPEGGGLPWPILIGAGVALLGIVVFIATRKKEQPPY